MKQKLCKIIENKKLCQDYFLLKLNWENAGSSFLPGQFVEILVSNLTDPLLRKPFSIFNTEKNSFSIVYRVIGKGTQILSQKKQGDSLDVIGALGNGYDISKNNIKNKNILLVGGGTGVASLFYLANVLIKQKIKFKFFAGFRSKQDIFCFADVKKINISTDDGSFGYKGLILDLVKKDINKNSVIFTCGPKNMLIAMQKNFSGKCDVYASFEEYMACGIGICSGCVVKIKDKENYVYSKVCKDGPVFKLTDIMF
jgi:dihydroorotate dehydrogenase electron transfer subunit